MDSRCTFVIFMEVSIKLLDASSYRVHGYDDDDDDDKEILEGDNQKSLTYQRTNKRCNKHTTKNKTSILL